MTELREVTEGGTTLLVPEEPEDGVPRADSSVFYNPHMQLNRDLTVLAVERHLEEWPEREVSYLDATAGTGIRGIRVANEAGGDVTLNDRSREAAKLMEKNLERSGVEAEVRRRDANALLSETGFDVVDIDPFGSPAPFTDSAARSIHGKGLLCLTATDTAPLCGAHFEAGRRRYDARPLNDEHEKEVGARILLGFAARSLARYDKAARPLLTLYDRHFFRLFLTPVPGGGKADTALDSMGHLLHCRECRSFELVDEPLDHERRCRCGAERRRAGPLWTGDLQDPGHVEELLELNEDHGFEKAEKILKKIRGEAGMPPLYYDYNLTASRAKTGPPGIRSYVEALREEGYSASRTHFDPEAVKTDAPPEEQERIMRETGPT